MNRYARRVTTGTIVSALMAVLTGASGPVLAQPATIDRVKLTDNELSCAQLHAESAEMDKLAAEAKAAEASGNNTAMAGSAGNVAAEVAGRSGLFGAIGGLSGQIFGQVAAKTAATATQQSGQMTAQQAAERARQAAARKEHVSTLFLNKGCKTTDLGYNPPAPPQTNAPAAAAMQVASAATTGQQALSAPAAPVNSLPDTDPDSFFKGQTGGTFGKNVTEVLPGNKRVAVAGFRVAFINSNTAYAQVRGSYLPGRDTSGASSTLIVTLAGVDTATLQALTDRAYADFLAQIRLAGREVVPPEELKELWAGLDVSGAPGKPVTKEVNAQIAGIFAPGGLPLWFDNRDGAWGDKSPFDQKNMRRVAEYSHKLNAIVVAPLIVVNFARMSSSGNQSGLIAREAQTGASLQMHTVAFSSGVVRSEETRSGLVMKGDDANIAQTRAFISELQFGNLKDVAATDNKATKGVFDALGSAMGMANAGGAARSKQESVAETSNAQYAAAAGDALVRATGTFAKWFQKYPAR